MILDAWILFSVVVSTYNYPIERTEFKTADEACEYAVSIGSVTSSGQVGVEGKPGACFTLGMNSCLDNWVPIECVEAPPRRRWNIRRKS